MSTNRLPISVDIRVGVTEQGNLDNIVADAQRLREEFGANVKVTAQMGRSSEVSRSSVRGLAFDLRLVSSGLSILQNELEGVNAGFDGTVRGLRVLSAGFSAALGTFSFMNRLTNDFGDLSLTASSAVKFLKTNMDGLAVATKAAVWIFSALVAIQAGVFVFELVSGVGRLRDEIRDLNQELEIYELQLIAIQNQTVGLQEDQALLNFVISNTERAIEKQGYATAQQMAVLAAAKDQQQGLNNEMSRYQYLQAQITTPQTRAENQIRENELIIQRTQRAALDLLMPDIGWRTTPLGAAGMAFPGAQLTGEVGRSGLVNVEAGEVIMQKEQMATMLQGGGGGNIAVSISFPGAVISSGEDMEGALRRGASAAGAELRRQMEMDRYRIKRRP